MMPMKWYTISLRKLAVARKKIYKSVYFEVIFAPVLRMLSVFIRTSSFHGLLALFICLFSTIVCKLINRKSLLLIMSILCHNLVTYKHNNCTIMNYFLELIVCQELARQDNWPHCKELLCTTR